MRLPSPLLLDGATGTELERRGVDIALPLWSARAIDEAPAELQAVHEAYLQAGAGAITTATFRTHERTLARVGRAGGTRAHDAETLTHRAAAIARAARDAVAPQALVLGSVAPLEDCYRPELAPDEATAEREHGQQIDHLLAAGVDAILLETMGTRREVLGAVAAARARAPGRWMLSCCHAPLAAHPEGPAGRLLDGTPIVELAPHLAGALALGANCVAATEMLAQVRAWRAAADAVAGQAVGIIAYANVGLAAPDGNWISTDAVAPKRYAAYAAEWLAAGATIVGGCCGTTPETIRAVRAVMQSS